MNTPENTYYMHTISGDVATEQEWKDDFNSTDLETWFGRPIEECVTLDWLGDQEYLVEVKQVDGDWVEA
jgi:hypothetical protein